MNVDVIVVGSGGAGLLAGIVAARRGKRVILLESREELGGTTAYSGGALWIPNNPFMAENGVPDDEDKALRYMANTIRQSGKASSPERRLTYVRTGPEVISFCRDEGLQWEFNPYPDYFKEEGASYGRGVGLPLIDGGSLELGPWLKKIARVRKRPDIAFIGDEMGALIAPFASIGNFTKAATSLARTAWWRATGRTPLFMGQSLIAQLLKIALRRGVDIRLSSPMTGLVSEGDRVVGVVAELDGKPTEIRAEKVILCAGGFAHNTEFRRKYQPVGGDYTVTAPGDMGVPLQQAMKLGAATELMDQAWWAPTFIFPDGLRVYAAWERHRPYSLIVDQAGHRYMNEAKPYLLIGQSMLDRDRESPAVPSWFVMDARHRRRYAFCHIPSGQTPAKLIDQGFFIKADTLPELAAKCGMDPQVFAATMARFNQLARTGKDDDFQRGETDFDRSFGDWLVKPNPALGTVEQGPFYAVKIYPGDIGTKGGLLTDVDGRVLRPDGSAIAGLYASGNTTASIMGHSYPGPGATIGPAMVFAYRAALHDG